MAFPPSCLMGEEKATCSQAEAARATLACLRRKAAVGGARLGHVAFILPFLLTSPPRARCVANALLLVVPRGGASGRHDAFHASLLFA